MNQLDGNGSVNNDDFNISQRRADAAVLMAETSLQQAGREIANADRYQVIVSVEAADITASTHHNNAPSKRPSVKGAGPIARETACRIACDCCLTTHTTSNGEPMDIGRKSRIWPNATSRTIKERDQHCQYPGCTRTNYLQIHHIEHWADGGSTSVSNGACLCSFHQSLVHEGGYTIERVADNEHRMNEQFQQQRHTGDTNLFNLEKDLRNDGARRIETRSLSFRYNV